MLPSPLLALLVLWSAFAGPDTVVRRIVVQDTVVFRIPVRPPPPGILQWQESKGPKCLYTSSIVGASMASATSVDFVLTHHRRVRAEIDQDCPAIDFYNGFYVEPEDERICAKRDELHSRMGGACKIRRFKLLRPQLTRWW